MTKYLIPAICLALLFFSSLVRAETKTFIEEYTYQASKYDSKEPFAGILACTHIDLD